MNHATKPWEIQAMNEAQKWQRVLIRDTACDGSFVYAVRSTGIYCRPSCPSRRPKRQHVVFFSLPELAERAGFRPCHRCRPQEAKTRDPRVEKVRGACRYIDAHRDETPTLAALSEQVGMSPYHFQRVFKRIAGISPRQYGEARRLTRFKEELRKRSNVTAAIYEAGYGSSSRLYERAPFRLGMTPSAYQRGGRGSRIRYTLVACPLGRLLLAATERGVCKTAFGDDDAFLETSLRSEFPAAEIDRDDAGLGPFVAPVMEYLKGWQPHLDLPLDVRATAFQGRVWQALQSIPYGKTRSYGEVARAVGLPGAARVVARACATNPVALLIPCHRVLQKNGKLGGYRWGTKRKQTLLALERASSESSRKTTRKLREKLQAIRESEKRHAQR